MKNFIILLKANFSANPFISTSAAGDKKPRSKVAASLLLALVAAFMVFFSASISLNVVRAFSFLSTTLTLIYVLWYPVDVKPL